VCDSDAHLAALSGGCQTCVRLELGVSGIMRQ
jgi:hypothetical protein